MLWPQDFIYLTGLLVMSALTLFLFTAIVFFPKGIRLPERRLARSTPTPSIGADEAGEA